jgi:17beta-estradiol 17-dehydrogenase / very-long-chain 3-oxoacyl-CoA reductase
MGDQCVFQNPDMSFLSRLLAGLGVLLLAIIAFKLILSICRGLYHCYVGQMLGLNVDFKKFAGRWAVITGASDGIGRAYSEQLAAKGLNIVLISRTLSKLEDVAKGIQEKYKVETKVIAVDFSSTDRAIYDVIRKTIGELELAVLVNNVGMMNPYFDYFTLVSGGEETMDKMIQVNCTAATLMMRMVLPGMVERRQGVIINVSSLMAIFPVPLVSVYAGCKAYMDFVSQANHVEYSPFGIHIQSVKPGLVATKMSMVMQERFGAPTPDTYVKAALSTVGLESSTCGYPPHKLQGYLLETLMAYIPNKWIMKIYFMYINGVRNENYRKQKLADPFKAKNPENV